MKAPDRNIQAAGNCCGREATPGGFLVVGNQPHPLVAIRDNFLDILERHIPREFDTEPLTVTSHRCNPHANPIDRNLRREAHDLVGLGHAFPFFARLAVGRLPIDPWNQAGRQRGAKFPCRKAGASLRLRNHTIDFEGVVRWSGAIWVCDALHLLDQLQNLGSARARGRLIRHRCDPFDESCFQKATDGHQHQADGTVAARKCAEPAGQTVASLAATRSCDPIDQICDHLIADHGATRVLVTSMSEDDIRTIVRSPTALVGSDGNCVATYGTVSQGMPHPRFYGTFPRVIARFVGDERLIPLEQAIHKMTGGSAKALKLRDRGLLKVGYCADLAIFDPNDFRDQATYADPHRYPSGARTTVIVNGTVVVENASHTGATPGLVLRRGVDSRVS